MEYNFNFNNYHSFNDYQNNNHSYENNKENQSENNKYFKIKETTNEFFIKNNKNNKSIKLSKINISQKENYNNEILALYDVDSIIGIFEINDKKYLGVVISSKVAAKILNYFLFKITQVKLIKMTNIKESSSDKKIKEDI